MADLRQPIDTDLKGVDLRPQARPVDSYVRPAQPEKSNAGELLMALGKIAPEIQKLGIWANHEPSAQEKQAAEALARVKYGADTSDQLAERIQKNPGNDPVAHMALSKEYGRRIGSEGEAWIRERVATGDPASMDPDKLVQEFHAEAAKKIGDNKWAAIGFTGSAGTLAEVARKALGDARNSDFVAKRNDTVFATMTSDIDKQGGDPAKVQAVLQEHFKNNQQFLGMTRDQQEKFLTGLAENYANKGGSEKIIDAIGSLPSKTEGVTIAQQIGPRWIALQERAKSKTLTDDRHNVQESLQSHGEMAFDGKLDEAKFKAEMEPYVKRGSVTAASVNGMIHRNQRAIEQQKNQALKMQREVANEVVAEGLLPNDMEVVRSGRAADLEDHSSTYAGKTVNISSKDRVAAALDASAKGIAVAVARNSDIPDDQKERITRERQIALYGKNGQTDPRLERSLKQLANTSTFDDEQVKSVATYLPELAYAQKASPKAIYDNFKEKPERTFIDSLLVAHEAGIAPKAALETATRNKELATRNELPVLNRENLQKTLEATKKELGQTGWFDLQLDRDVKGRQALDGMISRHAEYWYAAGAKGDDLVKRVATSLKESTAYVGGHYIPTYQLNVPRDTVQKVFESAAADVKAADPRFAKSEVTFLPTRPGGTSYQAFAIGPSGIPEMIGGSAMEFTDMHRRSYRRETEVANKNRAQKNQINNDPNIWNVP